MSVESITKYRQLDGREILKVRLRPTKKYPNAWFYVDSCFEDLVRSYCWYITNDYVEAHVGSDYGRTLIKLHQEIAFRCLGRYPDYIDHCSGLEIDNIGANLSEVTNQQNQRNRQSKGYHIHQIYKSGGSQFQPTITFNYKIIHKIIPFFSNMEFLILHLIYFQYQTLLFHLSRYFFLYLKLSNLL